jgi:hypothetical protein
MLQGQELQEVDEYAGGEDCAGGAKSTAGGGEERHTAAE